MHLNNQPSTDQSTYQQMVSHQKLSNFILYSVSYMFFGQVYTALGPMFPYLASIQNRQQTEYSFLFSCRAVGFVAGSLSVRLLSHMMTLHHFAALGICLMSLFSVMFYVVEGIQMRGVFVLLSSIGCSYQDIILNLAALRCFQGEKSGVWLQMLHGFFGIGGLVGPFAVYLFELKALTVIGTLSMPTIIFYFYFPTPQYDPLSSHLTQTQVLTHTSSQSQSQKQLPQISIYILSSAFFFTVGQETTYGGWVSSYAVLYGFSNKQHATMFSSLYWVSITFFRFFLALVAGSASRKVELLAMVGVINSATSYLIIFYIHPQVGLYTMSLLYGLCNSVLYALLLTIPQQFGYRLTVGETTSFVIWASLGEGTLAVVMGKLMDWLSYNWLIYGMMFMDFAVILLVRANRAVLSNNRDRQGLGINGNQLLMEDTDRDRHGIEMMDMMKMRSMKTTQF